MDLPHGVDGGVGRDDERDTAIGRTLGDGDDVDAAPTQRTKDAGRDAWRGPHPGADDADDHHLVQ